VQRAAPEVKPRLVRHALRVIGEHPAGASLRAMEELYRDLVKDEIKLRLALDGSDKVGVGKPFGLLLSLRFTDAVDRETGGFAKYLQNGAWVRVGNQFQPVDYRDQLQKTIESAFGKDYEVGAIGFFPAFMPPRGVVEGGQDGWLEKPLAYIVLTRKDPAIDTVPAVVMDMQFTDQTGPVTLAVASNTPLLATGESAEPRACAELEVSQLVDVRAVHDGAAPAGSGDGLARADDVTLEVRMRGKGIVPEVRDALVGLEGALAGYGIAKDGIEADPPVVLGSGDASASPFFAMRGGPTEPKEGYPEPDANGMYRLPIERSFRVRYERTASSTGSEFRLPTLAAGLDAKLESRTYSDLDIVPVTGASVPVAVAFWTPTHLVGAALGAAVLTGLAILGARRRRPVVAAPTAAWAPARLTPLGVVTSLRRLEESRAAALSPDLAKSLRDEIVLLELKYFGPTHSGTGAAAPASGAPAESDLRNIVDRWDRAVR
jgi:hypothetical protein